MRRPRDDRLETSIETAFVSVVEADGNKAIKMRDKSWPDRQVLLKDGIAYFIEFKRLGEEPRINQRFTHEVIRNLGFEVLIFDDLDEAVTHYRRLSSVGRGRGPIVRVPRNRGSTRSR